MSVKKELEDARKQLDKSQSIGQQRRELADKVAELRNKQGQSK